MALYVGTKAVQNVYKGSAAYSGLYVGTKSAGGGGVTPTVYPVLARSGDGSVGTTYTVTPGTWPSGTVTHLFTADGVDIPGSTANTYVATTNETNKTIGVRETNGSGSVTVTAYGPVLPAPILLWDFDTLTGTTNNGSTSVLYSVDTVNKIQGTGSIKATFTGLTNGPYIQKTNVITAIPADLGVVALGVSLDTVPEYQNISSVDVRLGQGGTYYTQSGVTARTTTVNATMGLLWHSFPVSQVPTLSGLPSGAIDVRVLTSSSGGTAAPYAATPRLEVVVAKADGIPTYVMTWDDGRQSIKDWILPQLAMRGLVSTLYWPPANAGTSVFMPTPDVKSLFDAGWDICIDGMPDDTSIITQPDMATVLAGVDSQWAALAAAGMTSDARFHMCYPNGNSRVVGTVTQVASATSDGGPTVLIADTTGITTGQVAASYLAPPGLTVLSVVANTSVTLSGNVTAGTKPMSFTVTSSPFYTGKVQAALKAKGIRTIRSTNNGTIHTRFGFGDQGLFLPGNSMSSTGGNSTAAQMRTVLDAIKLNKTTAYTYGHAAVDSITSGLDTLKTELAIHFDEVAAEVQAQRIVNSTPSKVWARDGYSTVPF